MDWRCSCASVKEMYMYWLISDILHRPDAHLSDIDHCSSGHAPTATVPVAFHIIASSAPSVRLFNKATHCRPSARIALLPSPACTTIVCAQGRKFRLSPVSLKGNARQEAAALTFVPSSAPSCQTFSSRAGACGLSRRTIQPIPYHSPPPPLRSAFIFAVSHP